MINNQINNLSKTLFLNAIAIENQLSRKFKIGVFKTRDMFKLIKTTPFKLKYRCNVEETPLSLDEQREYIKDRTEEIERIKAENFPKLLKIPIDVVDDEELKSQFKSKG